MAKKVSKKPVVKPVVKAKPKAVSVAASSGAARKASAKSPRVVSRAAKPVAKAGVSRSSAKSTVVKSPVARTPVARPVAQAPTRPAVALKALSRAGRSASTPIPNPAPTPGASPTLSSSAPRPGALKASAPKLIIKSSAKPELVIKSSASPAMKSGLVKSLTRPKVKTRTLEPIIVRLPPPPVTSNSKMAKNQAGLSTKELETFRDLLLQKRRELLGDMSSMEGDALRSGNTNLSTLPLHMADSGTDNYEQEFTLNLVEKERKLLGEIQRALAKIQDGSYGVCEGTGKPIGKPRLEAQPWAKYSIEHARALEKPQYRRAY